MATPSSPPPAPASAAAASLNAASTIAAPAIASSPGTDQPAMIGWSHTPFGRHHDLSLEQLIVTAARDAMAKAEVDAADIDAIVVGHFNEGFVDQGFPAALTLQADDALRYKPALRVENACATGTAAIHTGLDMMAAGRARRVLVVGVEKMTHLSSAAAGDVLIKASHRETEGDITGGFVGMFAHIARTYFQAHGDQSEALAAIAAKNHAQGAKNPLAQMQKDLGFAFCNTVSDKNPMVVAPLRRTDCSLVSDGAAAVVLASGDAASAAPQRVRLRSRAHVTDFYPMARRDMTRFTGAERAWAQALAAAGLSLDELDFVETHDCFTIAELIEYEAMGLTAPGQGARAILEGWTQMDGRLPVNPSGGLKAKGHPIGATGVSMHVMAARQLTGEADAIQLPRAARAGIFNMGGAGVANYVSILEAA